MLLDNNGNVVNEITYDAFGNITLETHPDVNFRFSYTGREFDSETGLYNYRARYYDPGVGRFISEDPIGFEAGDSNIYRYVGNNPLFYVDPSGFCGVAASGEPEFFGPAFGPDSSPGGSDIGSGLDFFGLGGFSGFAPGGFGGFGVAPFPGDGTVKVAGSLTSDSLLDDDSDDSLGPDPYQLPDPYYGLGSGAGDLGPWVGIGVGLGLGSHFSQTDDGYKFTIDVKNIGNGFQDWWNRLTKGDDSNEFDPTIIDVFDGDLGISTNVEKFPRPDDFLKGDTFTFPGSGNVKVKDYIETFPKGIDDWLESPFFESSNNDNLDDFLHPDPGSLISSERELAQKYGVSTRDVKDAIHASKRSPEVRANTKNKNPDIGVDETGEIYIKLGKEKFSGDSIGNIQDYLP
jgi:RHS repeat-associated protein